MDDASSAGAVFAAPTLAHLGTLTVRTAGQLGEELKVMALLRRTGFHEIQVVVIEVGALEGIQHVVHVEFCQAVG